MNRSLPTLGFLGLGAMGGPMVIDDNRPAPSFWRELTTR
jgi:hypothetical protein